jgi:hypothetical protein
VLENQNNQYRINYTDAAKSFMESIENYFEKKYRDVRVYTSNLEDHIKNNEDCDIAVLKLYRYD